MKKFFALILALVLVLSLSACSKVSEVEEAIAQIGTVTLDSKTAIEHAEALFNELSSQEQLSVENSITLTAAREEYDRLAGILHTATDAIQAIGQVTLDSGDAIEYARETYEALAEENLTTYAVAYYPILQQAEKDHAQCYYDEAMRLKEQGYKEDALWYLDVLIITYPDMDITAYAKEEGRDLTLEFAEQDYLAGNWEAVLDAADYCDYFYTPNEASDALRAKIMAKLEQLRPASGYILSNQVGSSYGTFTFIAYEKDICIRVELEDQPEKYAMVYVRAGETGYICLPNGVYIIEFTTGDYWFGKDAMFGEYGEYYRIDATATFTTSSDAYYIYYTDITLDMYSLATGEYDYYEIEPEEF